MATLLLLCVILVFQDLPSVLSSDEGVGCVTPNKELGICTQRSNCPVIRNALEAKSVKAEKFARLSECGYSTHPPLVCCGNLGLPIMIPKQISSKPDGCGQDSQLTISRGEDAVPREFRWKAWLLKPEYDGNTENKKITDVSQCEGSLINKRYVLTAANCIKPPDQTVKTVKLGNHCDDDGRFKVCNPPAVDYGIESIVVHPHYTKKSKVHDIALVKLNRNVIYTEHIQPICLPKKSNPLVAYKTVVWVSGWKETETDVGVKLKFIKNKLLVASLAECIYLFLEQSGINDMQICARETCENRNCSATCIGSSGGSLIRRNVETQRWMQEGIRSFSDLLCGSYPAVYTKVSEYVEWITDNTADLN